ncbi:MAG: SufD family Fe-S cluster assembly protein [Patescibacteria group bacterium]
MNIITIDQDGDRKIIFDKPGKYLVFLNGVSGEFVFEILVPSVDLEIKGKYLGKSKEEFNVRTIQLHKAPNSTSNLLIKGVFDEKSTFAYRGLVRIEKDCNGSHAYQKNQNILLSDFAKVTSEPDLEILSPDVFCTHGSTTGGVSDDALYYMRSRGLVKEDATKLFIEGFLHDVNLS